MREQSDPHVNEGEVGDDVFATERPRLVGLAYRMLGSVADAEDVVQEAWLRWNGADRAGIEQPAAWLTTVTTRLTLDRLRQQRRDRERYVGPWLPEPILTDTAADPADAAELAESLTLGFLVLLDELSPVERAVVLLADVFGFPYATIADAVGRNEAACRQLAHRARERVRRAPRPAATTTHPEQALRFRNALASGDADTVLALLAPDVRLVSDGGELVHAARRPVVGADRVARLLLNLAKRVTADVHSDMAELNAAPGFVLRLGNRAVVAVALELDDDGRITAVQVMANPSKLDALDSRPALR
jgi:RNA polymerase sigma-70 factor (ECF subfamily)